MTAMATAWISATGNALLPGSGLVARDRLACGLPLLVLTVLILGLWPLTGLLATATLASRLRLGLALAYGILALVASLAWWLWEHPRPMQPRLAAELSRAASRAYLRGELDEAWRLAIQLCRCARDIPGAWQLRHLIATARKDQRAAAVAQRRWQRLQERLADSP